MELNRIQKFVKEHVDASLPAENQTLILSSEMDLMGGANGVCANGLKCNTSNGDCVNAHPCGGANLECVIVTNKVGDICKN